MPCRSGRPRRTRRAQHRHDLGDVDRGRGHLPGGAVKRDRFGPDDGQATAFTVVMVSAFVFCLGLVLDGGGLVRSHTQAIALAQEAARVGTQQ
ncbi:pilus assembly protein TadG-related protein, partial [Nocardiopsis lucentensis]|uniref:pilus assembly protein TadG-related protein n=1 Tax=Nocardiopsis lucentensis TaxID=53441 RepID=UPI003083F122